MTPVEKSNPSSGSAAYLPLWYGLGSFLLIWGWAESHGSHWWQLVTEWRLQLAVIARAWFGAVAPIGSATLTLPVLLSDGQLSPASFLMFSFAVQAVALTTGTTYILCRKLYIDWPVVRSTVTGTIIGTPIGLLFLAPELSSILTISCYSIVWGSFGFAALLWLRDRPAHQFPPAAPNRMLRKTSFACGLLGGLALSSVIGSGSTLPLYAVLVFLGRLDVKNAAATCTVIAAVNAWVGLITLVFLRDFEPAAFQLWLAVAPAAALSVPLAWAVADRIRPQATLSLAALCCLVQAGWLLIETREQLPIVGQMYVLAGLAGGVFVFRLLYLLGVVTSQPLSQPDNS